MHDYTRSSSSTCFVLALLAFPSSFEVNSMVPFYAKTPDADTSFLQGLLGYLTSNLKPHPRRRTLASIKLGMGSD